MTAVVRAWWQSSGTRSSCYEPVAEEIRYIQGRRVRARKSHTKTTIARLHALGIRLKDLPRCRWNTT